MDSRNLFGRLARFSAIKEIGERACFTFAGGLILISLLLAACDAPAPFQAGPEAVTPATGSVTSGTILLDPAFGDADSAVTVEGAGWQPGREVLISITIGTTDYNVARATVDAQGQFAASFVVPAELGLTVGETIPVQAQVPGSEAAALATFRVAAPPEETVLAQSSPTSSSTPTPSPTLTPIPTSTPVPTATPSPVPTRTPTPAQPEAIVSARVLNVRSGPGTVYDIVGQVTADEELEITGRNGNWWQISFPGAASDLGWVSGSFVVAENTSNVPVVFAPATPIPTATSTPTLTPTPRFTQCSPNEWTGCGGRPPAISCNAEYVSQCQSDGTWGQCIWDPGTCGGGDYDFLDDDDDNDDDDDDDDDSDDDDDDSDDDD